MKNGKDGREAERARWSQAQHGCTFLLDNGARVTGKVTWVSEYVVGFVPYKIQDRDDLLEDLAMVANKESMVMKGLIRVMTPETSMNNGRNPRRGD